MYILASDLKKKKDDKYVFKARNACCFWYGVFSLYRFFQTNQMSINLYLYIRNLENSRLKPVFRYIISICICVGR